MELKWVSNRENVGNSDINIQVLNKINGIYDLDKQHIFCNLRFLHSNQNVTIHSFIKWRFYWPLVEKSSWKKKSWTFSSWKFSIVRIECRVEVVDFPLRRLRNVDILGSHLDNGFGINKLRLSKLVLFKLDYLCNFWFNLIPFKITILNIN